MSGLAIAALWTWAAGPAIHSPGLGRLIIFLGAGLLSVPGCLALPSMLRSIGVETTNYQGRAIGAAGGLLFALSVVPWAAWSSPGSPDQSAAVGALGFGLLGFIDDAWGDSQHKGLRGHLRALQSGRVTTGLLKAVGGLLLAGTLAGALQPGPEALVAAPLIALSANAFNLLDLRPLRALKLFWLGAGLLVWTGPALLASLLGLSLPYARLEARRRVMLGDTGANLLGGVLGTAWVLQAPLWGEVPVLLALVLFHAWAEKHSLTRWIEAHPRARALDGWGWRDDRSGKG